MMMLFIAMLTATLFAGENAQVISEDVLARICEGVTENTFVENVADCSSYIRCEQPVPVVGFCPTPFRFDPINQWCTLADKVQCYSCPPEMIDLPVENSCDRYISCIGEIMSERYCTAGTLFNRDINKCDLASNVVCPTTTTTSTTTTSTTTTSTTTTSITTTPTSTTSTTTTSTPIPSVSPTNLLPGEYKAFRDGKDCSIGIVCSGVKNGNPKEERITCKKPLYFDPSRFMCVAPADTNCVK